jgi:hypothetical protein
VLAHQSPKRQGKKEEDQPINLTVGEHVVNRHEEDEHKQR